MELVEIARKEDARDVLKMQLGAGLIGGEDYQEKVRRLFWRVEEIDEEALAKAGDKVLELFRAGKLVRKKL